MSVSDPTNEDDILDFDPRNLPASLRKAIGLVAASSALTESVVQSGIAGCLGVDPEYGWAITTHLNGPTRDQILRSVAEIRIEDLDALDELDRLLDDVSEATAARNNHIHNQWCRKPSTAQVYAVKIKARGRVETELIETPIEQIEADAKRIYDTGIALYQFFLDHNLISTMPSEPRPRGHKSKAARKERRKAMGKARP